MQDNRVRSAKADASSSNVTTRVPPDEAEMASSRAEEIVPDLQAVLEKVNSPLGPNARREAVPLRDSGTVVVPQQERRRGPRKDVDWLVCNNVTRNCTG
jgi:hypothetical protein